MQYALIIAGIAAWLACAGMAIVQQTFPGGRKHARLVRSKGVGNGHQR